MEKLVKIIIKQYTRVTHEDIRHALLKLISSTHLSTSHLSIAERSASRIQLCWRESTDSSATHRDVHAPECLFGLHMNSLLSHTEKRTGKKKENFG